MEHQQHFGRPRSNATELHQVFLDGLIGHVVPRLVEQVLCLLRQTVNVTGFGAGQPTGGDARLVGREDRLGGDFAKMVDEASPNRIGGKHRNLLAHDGAHQRLEQVTSTRDAVGAVFPHHGAEQLVIEQKGMGFVPPHRNFPCHEAKSAGGVLKSCFKAMSCERR